MKVKQLRARHPSRDGEAGQTLERCHALMEDGEAWRKLLPFWLPRSEVEGEAQYAERHARATYEPHVSGILGITLGALFEDPPSLEGIEETVWRRLEQDADRTGRGFAEVMREAAEHLLTYREAWTWADLPARKGPAPTTEADERDILNGVYLRQIHPLSVLDYGDDAEGRLAWVVFEEQIRERASVAEAAVTVWRWTAIDAQQVRRWEWKPAQEGQVPGPEDDATELAAVSNGTAGIPVVRSILPARLWLVKRLLSPAVALIRADNELAWSLYRAAVEMLAITSASPAPVKLGQGYGLRLARDKEGEDKAQFIGPSGVALDALHRDKQQRKVELYRVASQLAVADDPSAASARQSGDSKAQDWSSTRIMLAGTAGAVRDLVYEVGKVIARRLNKPDAEVRALGMEKWKDGDTAAFLASAALAAEAVQASPTLAVKLVVKQAAALMGEGLDADDLAKIEAEATAFYAGQTNGTGAEGGVRPQDGDDDAPEPDAAPGSGGAG